MQRKFRTEKLFLYKNIAADQNETQVLTYEEPPLQSEIGNAVKNVTSPLSSSRQSTSDH